MKAEDKVRKVFPYAFAERVGKLWHVWDSPSRERHLGSAPNRASWAWAEAAQDWVPVKIR